ncbi:hypothetical protein EMCRGX_G000870 [Ephydatia muelleri]
MGATKHQEQLRIQQEEEECAKQQQEEAMRLHMEDEEAKLQQQIEILQRKAEEAKERQRKAEEAKERQRKAEEAKERQRKEEEEAEEHLSIRGVWQSQTVASFDIRVIDTDAPSYLHRDVSSVLSSAEEEKKRKYIDAAEARRASFTPLVVSIDGVLGQKQNVSYNSLLTK